MYPGGVYFPLLPPDIPHLPDIPSDGRLRNPSVSGILLPDLLFMIDMYNLFAECIAKHETFRYNKIRK